MSKKKDLEFAVSDLNKVLKLNPAIEKGSEEQMESDIKEIEELLQPGDIPKLNEKSKVVMKDLGLKLPGVQDGEDESDIASAGSGESAKKSTKKVVKKKAPKKPISKKKTVLTSNPAKKTSKKKIIKKPTEIKKAVKKQIKPNKIKKTKVTTKELTPCEHKLDSQVGIIEMQLLKGVTKKSIIETLKKKHDKDEGILMSNFKWYMNHLKQKHNIEIIYSEKTKMYKTKT